MARIIDELFIAFEEFSDTGLDEFHQRWGQLDHLKDRQVVLIQGNEKINGQYLGINRQGAIRLALENHLIKEYYVGEVSVRAVK